jgi:cullin-associated NEDD8-dissociated protein 1
MKFIGVF